MKYERYRGTFGSCVGVVWKVVIMQDAESAFRVEELCFPYEEPLIIEWGETSKEDVIAPSTATLRIISPGDRTYEDLYTIEVGKIRMDVYRNDVLYWSGALDPEFYEEPYTCNSDYEVELTFSDFGILDRLRYNLAGRQNCKELLNYILGKSQINYIRLDESGMSTQLASSSESGLAQLDVRSDNFYDEDGEALSLKEVADGFLRPLGLRMEQRNGIVWIYDLNGAYGTFPIKKTEWQSEDQMMGTDKVVNNAKITLSTYSEAALLSDDKFVYPGKYDNETSYIDFNGPNYTFYIDYDEDNRVGYNWDYGYQGFTIFTNNTASASETGLAEKWSGASWFHIEPLFGGEEANGVAYMFRKQGHGSLAQWNPPRVGGDPATKTHEVLMRTQRVYIPKISAEARKNNYIRIVQEVLIDPRYNPFTNAGDANEGSNYNDMKVWFGYVMIPASVTLYDEKGVALQHYSNEEVAKSAENTCLLSWTKGKWISGAPNWGECWLEWYDPDDRAESSGVLGWKKNRHCIGLTTKKMYKSFGKMDEGQYIPYPDEGGYLEVCVYVGIWPYDYEEKTFGETNQANKKKLYEKIRWMLYKAPIVEIVKANILKNDSETDDIEYSSYINESAKEDLEIETICGTSEKQCPSSKAIFLNAKTGEQVLTMTRAGRTTQVEQLLLGTLYSQYAERKTKLDGTVSLNSGNISLYRDAMQGGKKFICLSDVQDLRADTSEVIIVELRPDEYTESKE